MPRLFWKIFLALWLSIMGFAGLMAWINQTIVGHNPVERQAVLFERAAAQAEQRLALALRQEDLQAARGLLRRLPRHVRDHLYALADGREVLGRDAVLRRLEQQGVQLKREAVAGQSGQVYLLIRVERIPPRTLLEPGWRGMTHRLLIAAVVSAFVSLLLARYLARPLERLGQASRRLASGDLAARVGQPLRGRRDEFGQLARDLDEMAERLQALQKANQRLLRDVSHELRSPLARLRVALELARKRDAGRVGDELDRIELESQRLEALVDEVLGLLRDSSEARVLRRERFDLRDLLSDLRDSANYEAPEHSAGVILRADHPLPVDADRELLWRAVENLLRNALAHTDPREGVLLSAERAPEGGVIVTVADRGPGVAEQHLTRLFEPFYRVQEARDRQSGGHGLGLAIAAAAVRRHGGVIGVVNRPGGGLAFRVELPATSE